MRLKEKPATVALFAAGGEKPALIFARSADAPGDMGRLLRDVSAAFGGRGGGQPEIAQGGVAPGSDLAQVVKLAVEKLR
jgi:alanyl-tRNA synthetase